MPNIFYKIQFKTELEGLNLELKNSKCQGLLIPKKHFFKKNKVTNKNEIDVQFVKTLNSFDKKVILYENYYRFRPSLMDPEDFTKVKDKKKQQERYIAFKLKCNKEDIETYFLEEIKEYNQIIAYVKKFLESRPTEGIKKLFSKKENFEILGFTIPYLPVIHSSYGTKKKYNIELFKCNIKATNIFYDTTKKFLKKHGLDNQYFTTTLVLEDFIKNYKSIPDLLNRCKPFKNIALWFIDFNDLTSTVKKIENLKKLIILFQEINSNLQIYYTGLYSSRLVEKIDSTISNFVRINGYPGLNINIPAIVQRSKRFLFQDDGKFYNPTAFSEEFLKTSSSIKYNCNCSVCSDFKIADFKKVFNFFIDNPISNRDYDKFRGKAKKSLENKLKAKQNSFLMKHNFYNLDHQLHLKSEEFKDLMFKKNMGIKNWKKFI